MTEVLAPQIRPVREIDMQPLLDAAMSDNHAVIKATHVIKKNGEFIGYISMGTLPTVLFWMHTKKANSRDSIAAITFYENVLAPAGGVIVPVMETSPYYHFMERTGYKSMGKGDLFIKGL
jgi:hypothetical protein